jgi:tripartite-type tricarboxylate transporter receptor subunit TctC
MRQTRRGVLLAAAAAATTSGTAPARAAAADWPQRPVRVVVPVAPGGSLDALSRLFGRHMGELGQP